MKVWYDDVQGSVFRFKYSRAEPCCDEMGARFNRHVGRPLTFTMLAGKPCVAIETRDFDGEETNTNHTPIHYCPFCGQVIDVRRDRVLIASTRKVPVSWTRTETVYTDPETGEEVEG